MTSDAIAMPFSMGRNLVRASPNPNPNPNASPNPNAKPNANPNANPNPNRNRNPNQLCIYSKRHLNNPPEQRGAKQKHNRMVMKKMLGLFKEGGKCVWVAPSGGRDRPDENGEYRVAPFDAKSVEMFRLMSEKAGRKSHFYPLSMVTADV